MTNQRTLDIWRNQARLYGTLQLSQRNWEALFSAAALRLEARGKVLADPTDMPDAVICALELFIPAPRRRSRAKVTEPT